jgi:hypothetical protein
MGSSPVKYINRGYHSRCTWTAPTEIDFFFFFSQKKKVFYRHQKMSLFQPLNFKWLYFFRFYSCAQNFLNSYIWLPDGLCCLLFVFTRPAGTRDRLLLKSVPFPHCILVQNVACYYNFRRHDHTLHQVWARIHKGSHNSHASPRLSGPG